MTTNGKRYYYISVKQKILVVDDDLYIRELYQEVLQNAGYDADTAVDGQDAIDKLKQTPYDLILLDLIMPNIDGVGVLNEIIQNPPPVKSGPIILLSNLGSELRDNKAMRDRIKDFIVKADITPDQLIACVRKHLETQKIA